MSIEKMGERSQKMAARVSDEEFQRLAIFVGQNGRQWKRRLRQRWGDGDSILAEAKEKIGPFGLRRIQFPPESVAALEAEHKATKPASRDVDPYTADRITRVFHTVSRLGYHAMWDAEDGCRFTVFKGSDPVFVGDEPELWKWLQYSGQLSRGVA